MMSAKILAVAIHLILLPPASAFSQSPPIIDLHFHFAETFDVDAVLKEMDLLGVIRAGNGARFAPDALATDWARRYPTRFIPFAGKEAIRRLVRDDGERAWTLQSPGMIAYVQELETALKAKQFKGIGEVHVYGPGAIAGNVIPTDSRLMQNLWNLSASHRVPFSAHMDARDETVAGLERLLASNRAGTWLWAHGGDAEIPLLRRLLSSHRNLYVELSGRAFAILTDGNWKLLLEDLPDRFIIGTDAVNVQQFSLGITRWRKVLAQLSPATATKLAHQNAERLLGLRQ